MIISFYCARSTRWKRPGVRGDLLTRLNAWGAGIASDGPNPVASPHRMWDFDSQRTGAFAARNRLPDPIMKLRLCY
jgi:hypothetical protein